MSDWNPDDGPPPTDEERAQARELADALAHGPGRRPRDPAVAELFDAAQRVRATAHPDHDRAREVAARAVSAAVARERPLARVLRWRVAAAVAAAGVVAFAVGVGMRAGDEHRPAPAVDLPPAFTEAVRPGAGAAPSTRLYDRRLRLYRDAYLRQGSR